MLKSLFLRGASLAAGIATVVAGLAARPAQAGNDQYASELMLVATNYCPRDWAMANGQTLAIADYQLLFSLIGTTFGGDGQTTFALPDLRGRAPIHIGTGPGLPSYRWGDRGGDVQFNLTVTELPPHNHLVNASTTKGNKGGPGDDYLAIPAPLVTPSGNDPISIYSDGPPNVQMDPGMIGLSGGGQPVYHRGPFLAMNWCIALTGLYPPRS